MKNRLLLCCCAYVSYVTSSFCHKSLVPMYWTQWTLGPQIGFVHIRILTMKSDQMASIYLRHVG